MCHDLSSVRLPSRLSRLGKNLGRLEAPPVQIEALTITVLRRMYQRKVDVDMLNAVKSALADVSSISPSSEHYCTNRASGTLLSHVKGDVSIYPFSLG